MSVIAHRIAATALVLAMSAGVMGSGAAQPVSREAIRKQHHSQAAHTVWIPGFWDITGNPATGLRAGWVWTPGRWVMQPVAGAHWVPGDWGWRNGWWSWIPGHWELPQR
jgi:WXXGXW repeat (2 copies)